MIILPFISPVATLDNAGGKGASLSRLTQLGLPVPPGFIITTQAYQAFVAANNLSAVIAASLSGIGAGDVEKLESASRKIRSAFSTGKLPEEIVKAVTGEYLELGSQISVAVRSSATAEDLPELSFAGQQDTFLNIVGELQLLKAVVDCWSSLWTARAIGYRARNAIPHGECCIGSTRPEHGGE